VNLGSPLTLGIQSLGRPLRQGTTLNLPAPSHFTRGALFLYMLKSYLVVGEYASDQGCSLPNPVSIHREYIRLRFDIEWRMQKLQKMKILGAECSMSFAHELDTVLRVFKGW